MVRNDRSRRAAGDGRLLGTCQGLSERSGVNANVLRVAAVVMLMMWFKLTIVLYCATALALRATRR